MRMTDMKRSRFTEEQIINFIKQAGAGMPIRELCRKGGFSDATPYKWRAKVGRMDVPDAKRLWGISKVRYQDLQKVSALSSDITSLIAADMTRVLVARKVAVG